MWHSCILPFRIDVEMRLAWGRDLSYCSHALYSSLPGSYLLISIRRAVHPELFVTWAVARYAEYADPLHINLI